MQLCSKPRGARGIEPETFYRRGQLLSRPPTTGPYCDVWWAAQTGAARICNTVWCICLSSRFSANAGCRVSQCQSRANRGAGGITPGVINAGPPVQTQILV